MHTIKEHGMDILSKLKKEFDSLIIHLYEVLPGMGEDTISSYYMAAVLAILGSHPVSLQMRDGL